MQSPHLLQDYIATRSHQSFTGLVDQNIDLVYSAARRQVYDPHLADDITQAVFLILANRANTIRNPAHLGGWLIQTTRHVAANAIRYNRRRIKHEQEAALMAPPVTFPVAGESESIAPILDQALSRLREKDRAILVLRFLQSKPLPEVAAALAISEPAAQKRLTRALGRLRDFFARRNVHNAESLAESLATQLQLAAPPALLLAVSQSLTTAAPTATLLAKTTIKTLLYSKLKLATIAAAASVALVASLSFVALNAATTTQAAAPKPSPAPEAAAPLAATTPALSAMTLPLHIRNASLATSNDLADEFTTGQDPDTKRTPSSDLASQIQSTVPALATPLRFVSQNTIVSTTPFLGKRIRITAWIKQKDVLHWSGLNVTVTDIGGHIYAQDDMSDRPIHNADDWQQVSSVVDVPANALTLYVGYVQCGIGQTWADDFQIDLAPPDAKTTDDQGWHKWATDSPSYSVFVDKDNPHDGHASFCMAYVGPLPVTKGAWSWYGHDDRQPEKFLGKRIRMSAWIKSESVGARGGPNIRPKGPNFQLLAIDADLPTRPIHGTTDWKLYTVECDIPKGTQCIDSGFVFSGKGKLWIDMESVTYEIIGDAPDPRAEFDHSRYH